VPTYLDVLARAQDGVASTLLPENLARLGLLRAEADAPTKAILFDPQTSGGLLAGVPGDTASACVAALRSAGYAHARIIGRVGRVGVGPAGAAITITGTLRASRSGEAGNEVR
jgi:selenide,water dikinase